MSGYLLFFDIKDLTVSLDGKVLKMQSPNIKTRTFPLIYIDQIVVYGNPKIYCNVWKALGDNGIPALILPSRGKGRPVWITPGLSTSVMIRKSQNIASENPETRDSIIRLLLQHKLEKQLELIKNFSEWSEIEKNNNHDKDTVSLLNKSLSKDQLEEYIFKASESIKNNIAELTKSSGRDKLMGYEGASANVWFSLLKQILSPEWNFSGRNRRPPKDPINALLSLSYTMAMTEVYKSVYERGMDPCIGFLHADLPGRDSFVLDILEPLRPGADLFCLNFAMKYIKPSNFSNSKNEGCRLDSTGRKIYFPNWSSWRLSWPYSFADTNLSNINDLDVEQEDSDEDFLEKENQLENNPFLNQNPKSLRICCLQIIKQVTKCFKNNN